MTVRNGLSLKADMQRLRKKRSPMNGISPDRPSTDDLLQREELVKTLADILVTRIDNERCEASNIVLGLTGPWGSGKSTVVAQLKEHLGKLNRIVVVDVNPWLLGERDDLIRGFFAQVQSAFMVSSIDAVRQIAGVVAPYAKWLGVVAKLGATVADAAGGGGLVTAATLAAGEVSDNFPKSQPEDLSELRAKLEHRISQAGVAVVVLVDELDRVEDAEVRTMARLIKALGDLKGFSYLVAYDPSRVADALGRGEGPERQKSGQAYLEKIIQFAIPLRELWPQDKQRLLQQMIHDHANGRFSTSAEDRSGLFDLLVSEVATPRDVKRLAGQYEVLKRASRGEICPIDVLAFAWLSVKFPQVRDAIARHHAPDRYDPDSWVKTISRSQNYQNENHDLKIDLGRSQHLLKKILPGLFHNSVAGHAHHSQHDRLSRPRNLRRLLYFGDPPGSVSRAEVEAFWVSDAAGMNALWDKFQQEGRLAELLDRVDSLVHELPASGDLIFFGGAAARFRRAAPFQTPAASPYDLIDEVGNTLCRLGKRAPAGEERFNFVFAALAETGDLTLAPQALRNEMFAHGTAVRPASGGEILDRASYNALLAKELARYRAAILDGTWLQSAAVIHAVYALSDTKQWDADLRAGLTEQLRTGPALMAFATMVTPPGYGTARDALDQLIDCDDLVKSDVAKSMLITQASLRGSDGGLEDWAFHSLENFLNVLELREAD